MNLTGSTGILYKDNENPINKVAKASHGGDTWFQPLAKSRCFEDE